MRGPASDAVAAQRAETRAPRRGLSVLVREWRRIGWIGFGGPPAHIAPLRELCVTGRGWLSDHEFEDAIAATSLLPARPVPSWRSTAPGAYAASRERSSAS